jgi:hypothetical protein
MKLEDRLARIKQQQLALPPNTPYIAIQQDDLNALLVGVESYTACLKTAERTSQSERGHQNARIAVLRNAIDEIREATSFRDALVIARVAQIKDNEFETTSPQTASP